LPPEINSALIFAGPGAAPLLAAAEAWIGLAEELGSSASSFLTVTSDLVNGAWQGPSSTAMMAVATQYVGFLSAAAAQAESASAQAGAIATAFETAIIATVQPAVVAANRTLVQALSNTNWFGLNTPAIMDTEAAYEQMWAADVAAMFGYHADASSAVAQLAPWQQILESLGIQMTNGQITFTFPGTTQAFNLGFGVGNSGSSNIGLGNLGNGNIGFGNSGNNDIGFGLTGSNQIGFGGFNSGSGNIGLFNSGTNNIGFFNSGNGNFGIGNSGSFNAGFVNSGAMNMGMFNNGTSNTGFFQDNPLGSQAADTMSSGRYVTGLSAANAGSSLLGSAAATGGLNPGVAGPSLLSSATPDLTSAGSSASVVQSAGLATAASGATPTPAAVRTTTEGYFAPTGNESSGSRTFVGREPGIPNSAFFGKGERGIDDAATEEGQREQGLPFPPS
jgi:PPE-repeat protein